MRHLAVLKKPSVILVYASNWNDAKFGVENYVIWGAGEGGVVNTKLKPVLIVVLTANH